MPRDRTPRGRSAGAVTTAGFRPDRVVRAASLAAGIAERIAWRTDRRRGPQPVDRDLRLAVTEVRREAPDVVALHLRRPGGGPLPCWRPGAHLDVVLPSGRVRQYSLCGDPADRTGYRIAVRLVPGGAGGSAEVHTLAAGTPLTVRGPRNAFPLVAAPGYLFLAGGIGITPIVAMAAAAGGRPWRLVHTGRDRASMPLSAALAERHPGRVVLRPDDEHGGPPTAAELLAGLGPGTAVYCCGPPPMTDAVRRAVPAGQEFHSERFSAPPVRGGTPFTLTLARSGRTLDVAADRSALDAVRAVLPDVAYSCRQGFCGTCHVGVLAGRTARDPAAPGSMALCVARASGENVVVDL